MKLIGVMSLYVNQTPIICATEATNALIFKVLLVKIAKTEFFDAAFCRDLIFHGVECDNYVPEYNYLEGIVAVVDDWWCTYEYNVDVMLMIVQTLVTPTTTRTTVTSTSHVTVTMIIN